MKIFILLIVLTLQFACSSTNERYLDNDLLFRNFEGIEEDYLVYTTTHFSYGNPSKKIPQFITQYIFIRKINEKEGIPYFELYKYSNYSTKQKLRDVRNAEYNHLLEIVKIIDSGQDLKCTKSSAYESKIQFTFYIKLDGLEKDIGELDLIPHQIDLLKKYDCLEEYLKMILFFREYEAATNFDED